MNVCAQPHPDGRTLWLCRHGDRMDTYDPTWLESAVRRYDAPISPKGERQADELGRRLKGEPIDRVFASPFLRAMQTAARVVSHTGHRYGVEHGLCELFYERWFNPEPELPEGDRLADDFPAVDPGHRSLVRPAWPENEDDALTRCGRAMQALLDHAPGNLLLICHGGAIQAIARSLGVGNVHTHLCCLIIIQWRDGGWRLVADGGDLSHLSEDQGEIVLK